MVGIMCTPRDDSRVWCKDLVIVATSTNWIHTCLHECTSKGQHVSYKNGTVKLHLGRPDASDGLDAPDTLDLTEPAVQRRDSARPYPFAWRSTPHLHSRR
jgi:hypothetical protein